MRKKLGLFIIVGMLMNVGVASADRGFWFSDTANSWVTIFNIMNTGASQVATVEFFDEDGVSLGSTTTTLGTNAQWNFSTSTIGTIASSTLEAGTRGIALVTGATVGTVRGHISIFNLSSSSGFQMRIRTGSADDSNVNW